VKTAQSNKIAVLYYGVEKSLFKLQAATPESGYTADTCTAFKLFYKHLHRKLAELRLHTSQSNIKIAASIEKYSIFHTASACF